MAMSHVRERPVGKGTCFRRCAAARARFAQVSGL